MGDGRDNDFSFEKKKNPYPRTSSSKENWIAALQMEGRRAFLEIEGMGRN